MADTVTFDDAGLASVVIIKDDGPWRRVYAPGDKVSGLPKALHDEILSAWTPDIIAAYQASLPEPDPILPRTEGTFREFMALFTPDEQAAIKLAERDSIELSLWMDRARGGPTMRLQHEDTIAGMAALVEAGLLTQERADAIVSADFDAV